MALNDIRETFVAIVLDKPRNLKFDLNAFALLEDTYGTMNVVFDALKTGSMKAARSLLWAALLHEDEALTERQVGGMVTMENISTVLDALTTALNDATPDAGANAAQEAAPANPL